MRRPRGSSSAVSRGNWSAGPHPAPVPRRRQTDPQDSMATQTETATQAISKDVLDKLEAVYSGASSVFYRSWAEDDKPGMVKSADGLDLTLEDGRTRKLPAQGKRMWTHVRRSHGLLWWRRRRLPRQRQPACHKCHEGSDGRLLLLLLGPVLPPVGRARTLPSARSTPTDPFASSRRSLSTRRTEPSRRWGSFPAAVRRWRLSSKPASNTGTR
jgi:hypothetical protein